MQSADFSSGFQSRMPGSGPAVVMEGCRFWAKPSTAGTVEDGNAAANGGNRRVAAANTLNRQCLSEMIRSLGPNRWKIGWLDACPDGRDG